MKQMRLTRLQVLVGGLVVVVGIAALFLLAFIRPQMQKIRQLEQEAEENEQYARAEGPKAKKDLEEAERRESVVAARFDHIMETRMPDVDLSDPIAGMFRLWRLPQEEGAIIDRWFRTSGAQVSGYSFPAFGTTPADPNMRVLPPQNWTLAVQVPDFQSLLKWLRKLPTAPRFMVMQSVTIQGPRQPGQPLQATVPVTLYEWTKAAKTAVAASPQPAVGEAAAAEGAGVGAGPGMGGRGPMGRGGMGMGGMRGGMGGGMRGGGMSGGMRGGG